MRLLLATRNDAKLVELRRILRAAGVEAEPEGLDAHQDCGEVAETGETFVDNALLKARAAHVATGLPAVADDSGLCVAALRGMPGVLSARWCGRHGDDAANNALLLGQLSDVPDERRAAWFACAAVAVLPGGRELVAEGELHGRLLRAPRGRGGFGYDPLFVPDGGDDRTTAELAPAEKDAISHRGRAFRALAAQLHDHLR